MIRYGRALRDLWALDDTMVYLNHGAFGATPRELLQVQQDYRTRLEAQPARFLMNELPALVRDAAAALAAFVNADPDRTVLLENATSGINAVLRSLQFAPGERIVTTEHVYNAVRNTLRFVAEHSGAVIEEVPLPVPLSSATEVTESLRAALAEPAPVRLVVIDHIASPSALRFPVADLVRLCHSHGIPVLVDGSHAPGMIDLDVNAIGADWYIGNGHKWLCAPKGVAFLVAANDQATIHPTVISHAYRRGLVDEFGKIGTRDPSAWLALPAAIEFHQRLGGRQLRERNRELAGRCGAQLAADLDTVLCGPAELFDAMVTLRVPCALPAHWETAAELRERLWQDHRIEVLFVALCGALWLRVSVQAYNEASDFARLAAAVRSTVAAAEARQAGAGG